jgi:uncharacterized protein (TIGR02001 family)
VRLSKTFVAAAAAAVVTSAFSTGAMAQAAAAAPKPDYELSFNLGAVTDYRYRGISQTRRKPTLQAGVDFAHSSGFYVGAWGSGIKWIKDAGGDASVEIDVYGGYKGTIGDIGYDVGVLTYQYPSNKLNPSANTTEIYGALTFGIATLKYSHSTTNLFGFANSKNSGYLDLNATVDLGDGWTVVPHIGHQTVRRNSAFSYTDYSITVNKTIDAITLSAGLVGTDTKAYVGPGNKNLGRGTIVLGAKFVF